MIRRMGFAGKIAACVGVLVVLAGCDASDIVFASLDLASAIVAAAS